MRPPRPIPHDAAFPDADILAIPQTVTAIKASKDGKLAYWSPILKDAAAAVILPGPVEATPCRWTAPR
ncbi:hypothetical protein PY32053_03934 (plasmid) [Paracoccus yeei]|uniref:Uncharacterized protein n=1 Tax=Paracoccus yeei TaxID=147645 RepID=A0A386URX2_9RHOB|nr:hypothetical protein [Paracoccus yeei]AYF03474.1 hypothetical protein PY32053_03934 [Paracoccus yeei]